MRIAVIGGGAAGLVSAHLLGEAHAVTLFEKEPTVGGNIRTIGRNVAPSSGRAAPVLDAGAIEFDAVSFPRFFALMRELGVRMLPVAGTTSLFLARGGRLLSVGALHGGRGECWRHRLRTLLSGPGLLRQLRRFHRRTAHASPSALTASALGAWLPRGALGRWLRLLMMYAYSIPSPAVDAMPAALTVPVLRDFTGASGPNRWYRVDGGVYSYVERILASFPGTVSCGAPVGRVRRDRDGVEVQCNGVSARFDQVVFASTPEVFLTLLAAPSEAERRRFGAWQANRIAVAIHDDDGIYARRNAALRCEFDLFLRPGRPAGYNCYLNRLCGLPDTGPRHWGLAFGLDDELEPARVVHRQPHCTPGYTVGALRHRDEVLADNGARRTWHVGAWLGNGLHEGAVASAERVAVALGGRRIRG